MLTNAEPEHIASHLRAIATNRLSYGAELDAAALVRAITNDFVYADAHLASQMLQDALTRRYSNPQATTVLRRLRTYHGSIKTLCENNALRADAAHFESVTCDALVRVLLATYTDSSAERARKLLLEVLE